MTRSQKEHDGREKNHLPLRPVLSVLLFALLFHVAFYFWCHNLSRTITRGKGKATPFWKKQQCFKDCQMTNL